MADMDIIELINNVYLQREKILYWVDEKSIQ